ncbi:hypothetical protein RHH25_03975 [Thermosynechococcus sp. PP42]|nr:hypothetical protein [Thermosynechococcus sp. PP42]MDR5638551.1 hypothetical protein [Thermosynechococcus sp. PP42]
MVETWTPNRWARSIKRSSGWAATSAAKAAQSSFQGRRGTTVGAKSSRFSQRWMVARLT